MKCTKTIQIEYHYFPQTRSFHVSEQVYFNSGEFRFRVSLLTKHLTFTKDIVEYLTLFCYQTLEKYIDGVMNVCEGSKPENAIDEIVKSFGE